MIRRRPRATRTDTRFTYRTLFRSPPGRRRRHREGGRGFRRRSDEAGRPEVKNGRPWQDVRKGNAVNQGPRGTAALFVFAPAHGGLPRSAEHTSALQSLMRTSYAVFCLKNKKTHRDSTTTKSA